MFVFIACLSLLSLSQTLADVTHPTLGPVYIAENNGSFLNFTIIYPTNYAFDILYVRFNLYDFIDNNNKSNPQLHTFQWVNFTDSNTSLPWVSPNVDLGPGDYVIGCFQWVRAYANDTIIDDTNDCVLTRTSINSTRPAIDQMNISNAVIVNNTVMVHVYYPQSLPYDIVNITSNLNKTIAPTSTNLNSNDTYMGIYTYSYTSLSPNTNYNLCIYNQYASSQDNTTYRLDTYCQSITTLSASRSYQIVPNILMIISLIIVAFI